MKGQVNPALFFCGRCLNLPKAELKHVMYPGAYAAVADFDNGIAFVV